MQIIDEFIEVPESLKLLSDFYPGKRIMMFDIETTVYIQNFSWG